MLVCWSFLKYKNLSLFLSSESIFLLIFIFKYISYNATNQNALCLTHMFSKLKLYFSTTRVHTTKYHVGYCEYCHR